MAVVGVGAAGLCAVRHLVSRSDTFSVAAFEQSDRLGGTWVYTDTVGTDRHGLAVHSSMYTNLRTNLPKEVMAFPDFEFDTNLPSFIKHKDVLQYLEDYATQFSLRQHIKFGTQVVRVQPKPCCAGESRTGFRHRWEVTSQPVGVKEQPTTEVFDAVIVCNGHYSLPLIPYIQGLETFPGEIMHSHNYREPQHFQNKRVVCLGASQSGQDISLDLSASAEIVYLCHNKVPLVSRLPSNVHQKSGIQSVQGSLLTLQDGSQITADCLLFCTGYHFTFPFLSQDCHLNIEDERISPLYKHLFHTEFPTLSFISICKLICPFPQFHIQVQLVMAVLNGSHRLPSKEEMEADTEADFKQRLADGMPARYAHTMGDRQWAYNDEMATMAGCQPIPASVTKLFREVHEIRTINLVGYKSVNYQMSHGEYRPVS